MATRAFPVLGWDPTPGEVQSVRDTGRLLGTMGAELGTILANVVGADSGGWQGKAAVAFIDHLNSDVKPAVQKCRDSFEQGSSVLYGWADQLDGFQTEAADLEREAESRQNAVDAAQAVVNGPSGSQTQPPAPAPAPGSAEASAKAAQDAADRQALTDADSALAGVKSRAWDLHERYLAAAKAVADQLHHAGKMAPGKPGMFHSLAGGVEHAFSGAWHWVEKHADAIKFVGDILSDVSAALGIMAILTAPFEPLGAIFAAASLTTGGLALGTHLLAGAAGANVSLLTLGGDVMSVVPGISLFRGEAKVVDGAVATARAAKLGDALGGSFKAGSVIARHWIGGAEGVDAAMATFKVFGRKVAVGGLKWAGYIEHEGSFWSRPQLIIENHFLQGQVKGTKLINFFLDTSIDPTGGIGRTIDAGIKIVPKLYTAPHGWAKDHKYGSPFHSALS